MRRIAPLIAAVLAAFAPHSEAATKRKPPTLAIRSAQIPDPASPGKEAEVLLEISAPEGVVLNRYPGVTVKVLPGRGVAPARAEVFVGSKTPIDDPDRFYFDSPVRVRMRMRALSGPDRVRNVPAEVSFFYCVKKSGYCAPGRQSFAIPFRVAGE